jgi:hypothetical protein
MISAFIEVMDVSLVPAPGFNWQLVRWDAWNAPQRDDCSYCGAEIPEDAVPLRMWDEPGNSCVFCDACAVRWWGLQPVQYDDDDDDRSEP